MERKKQEKNKIYDKDVYKVEITPDKWSVIIMPDNIIIDNYHGKEPHIHNDPKNHNLQTTIDSKTVDETYWRVMKHVKENKGIVMDKLIKELNDDYKFS